MLQLEETVQEFNSFTYDYSEKTGRVIYGAPPGFHDDIVFSHALAIWALQPVIKRQERVFVTPVERDIYEKQRAGSDIQEGRIDPTEFEVV